MKMMLIEVCRYKEGKSAPKDIGTSKPVNQAYILSVSSTIKAPVLTTELETDAD